MTLVQHLICKLFTLNKLMKRRRQKELNYSYVVQEQRLSVFAQALPGFPAADLRLEDLQ